jgi:hypothetical protein
MARTIEISDATYLRLKERMRATDTTESVIAKLIDEAEGRSRNAEPARSLSVEKVTKIRGKRRSDLEFINKDAPELTHAKLLLAYVDGVEVKPTKWNQLLLTAIGKAVKEDGKSAISGMSGIHVGKRSDSGYKFFPDLEISVQGQDANDAWRITTDLAKKRGWLVEALCEWRDKEGASYRGQSAILVSS